MTNQSRSDSPVGVAPAGSAAAQLPTPEAMRSDESGEVSASAAPSPSDRPIRLAVFEGGTLREWDGEAALTELAAAVDRPGAEIWIDLCSPAAAVLQRVCEMLRLHPLLVEDLAERDQRAKLEQVGDVLHMVLFSLGFDDGHVYDREIDMVLGRHFLMTSHSSWWDPRATRHCRMGLDALIRRGADHLMWALSDAVIDEYFPILDRLGDEIDDLEDEVVNKADRALLERLFELKRSLIGIRRVTAPEREMFNILSSRQETTIADDERLYFRDAYDHLIRLTDELDTYRELASATLETYLSTVNNNLSLIMKRLTGVTVVVAGIGAVAGVFGMSEAQAAFRLDEGPGFWIVTLGTILLAGIAVGILRRIDWI